MKKTRADYVFITINTLIMLVILIVTLYPFLHILAISLNDARDSAAGGITIFPRKFSIDSYITIFKYDNLLNAFTISVTRTVIGTVFALAVTTLCAYGMTKKYLVGYKLIYYFFVISMFVGGGLIPTFLLFRSLNLLNSFWVYIIPPAFSTYNMILFRTFFLQLPAGMEESAIIDGANEWRIYFQIILPLSVPILATIGLFIAVYQWNAWMDTLYFVTNEKLESLQYVLMRILRQSEAATITRQARTRVSVLARTVNITPESIKMAITIVATVPILCVYPFLQRFFVKGIVLGAVKG